MDQGTAILIEKYSPMWTNKQIWEYEQKNPELKFDVLFVEPKNKNIDWKSKFAYVKSDIREVTIDNFDFLADGFELWISNSKEKKEIDKKIIPYLMAVMADIMIDEEITLKFRIEEECLVVSVDHDADVIDCKEFFEEFYHLATGVNYDTDTGIPEDQTEAEIYLTRLQEEFDQKMTERLGDRYLPGNNDPDSINAE
ncbi:hypothetical protein NsoK4_04510 [Nitrosopumilus sp. K4]|uniref:hypothetical protein n=1 Tax=Nitrosopumilus sp. K4 TaxID=2795383 RepID=UPI001BA93055|nr:hypothetical protein [Nitrosopumilus sp. K4]QUC65504.1 hypothetical protein NsoK4_04510 [Nitrosopumilus sp. K4]